MDDNEQIALKEILERVIALLNYDTLQRMERKKNLVIVFERKENTTEKRD